MSDCKGSTSTITDIHAMHKELDEASCPICMDHPHNAVLLLCSSHEKGCRSYICDTSYRHSNCLDRFKKLRIDERKSPSPHHTSLSRNADSLRFGMFSNNVHTSESYSDSSMRNEMAEARITIEENEIENPGTIASQGGVLETRQFEMFQETDTFEESRSVNLQSESNMNLKCPLCRGNVFGWKIVKEARQYLDLKRRSCSQESCSFLGNYRELRRHARRVHPTMRPADTDPSREHAWRRLEHQREYGDIVSALRSAMPGAIVVGDYVIDNSGDGESGEFGEGSAPWWTTFFLFQMFSSGSSSSSSSNSRRPISQSRNVSRVWARNNRASSFTTRRYFWGENLLGLYDDDNSWLHSGDRNDDVSPRPRRRRRFARSRPSDD